MVCLKTMLLHGVKMQLVWSMWQLQFVRGLYLGTLLKLQWIDCHVNGKGIFLDLIHLLKFESILLLCSMGLLNILRNTEQQNPAWMINIWNSFKFVKKQKLFLKKRCQQWSGKLTHKHNFYIHIGIHMQYECLLHFLADKLTNFT